MAEFEGGDGDDSYTGTEGPDTINGGGGDDRLDGGRGDDLIDGGSGTNILRGGDGADTITSRGRHDQIEGGEGDNQIYIWGGVVGGTIDGGLTYSGAEAQALSDLFFSAYFDATSETMVVRNFATVSGHLYGTEGADRLDLSGLTAGPAPGKLLRISARAGEDRVVGSDFRDLIGGDGSFTRGFSGPGAADFLSGGGGDDDIRGDSGDDEVSGGDGNDRLYGGNGSDVVLGGSGDDLVSGGRLNSFRIPEGEVDRLDGGEGADVIYGGHGDIIDGGAGNWDQLWFDLSSGAAGVTADFAAMAGGAEMSIAGGIIKGIEVLSEVVGTEHDDDLAGAVGHLDGNGGDDRLSGSAQDNRLSGGEGDDTLHGLGGDDELVGGRERAGYDEGGDDRLDGGDGDDGIFGGRGNDLLIGGEGSDNLDGGAGTDTASYAGSGPVTVRLDVTTSQYTWSSGYDTLTSIENLIGSDYGDHLIGSDWYGNRLAGGAGDDQLEGRSGSDTLVGGLGADTMKGGTGDDFYIVSDRGDVVVELAGEGRDTVMASIRYRLGDGVEDLRLAGSAVNGSGNAADNAILGNRADNRINGLNGGDELNGGAGDDALSGNAGDDVLIGGAGRDTLSGGAGADMFRFGEGDSPAAAGQSDVIAGFSRGGGDRIDLSAIDADAGSAADDGFAFIGGAAFSGAAGELRATVSNGISLVQGDVDGDGSADFAIRVDAPLTLAATDFIL